MDHILWLIIMGSVSLLFTGLGIYARRRKKTDVVLAGKYGRRI